MGSSLGYSCDIHKTNNRFKENSLRFSSILCDNKLVFFFFSKYLIDCFKINIIILLFYILNYRDNYFEFNTIDNFLYTYYNFMYLNYFLKDHKNVMKETCDMNKMYF